MHKEGGNSEGINPLRRRSLQSIILRAVYLQQDKKSQNVAPLDYQLIHSLAQILRAFEKFKSTSPESSLMTYHLSLFTHTYRVSFLTGHVTGPLKSRNAYNIVCVSGL